MKMRVLSVNPSQENGDGWEVIALSEDGRLWQCHTSVHMSTSRGWVEIKLPPAPDEER